jgi:hypothetical protein
MSFTSRGGEHKVIEKVSMYTPILERRNEP